MTTHYIFWPTEFNQNYLHDHEFGAMYWHRVDSAESVQLKTEDFAFLLELVNRQYFKVKGFSAHKSIFILFTYTWQTVIM